jgi:predicted N-acetyltransferase YhbS
MEIRDAQSCDSQIRDLQIRDLQIRSMTLGDAEDVSALITQLGYSRSAAEVRDWIERVRSEGAQQAAFVACEGVDQSTEVIGWIEIAIERRLQSPPFALIGGLVVKNSVRSRGVGRALCAQAEAWAWEQGVETVRVTSRSTRADAHRFYLRDGYRETKTSLVFEKGREKYGEKHREKRGPQ